jgi:predicted CXXCH cytochrome family protein
MRRKILVALGVIVSIAMFVGVGALIAADVPDEISVKSKAFETHKKAAVNLSHKKHNVDYKIACSECHHVYKEGKNVFKEGDPVQACSECHDPVKSEGNVKKLMLAYHKNCQGCHKDLETAGKPAGPTKKCNDCHAKE